MGVNKSSKSQLFIEDKQEVRQSTQRKRSKINTLKKKIFEAR